MQITQIDLNNVKSYQSESITFTDGTNAICGPNGAGKSTLLEAIGFAIFDSLPYPRSQFVREGEKTATVTVHLIGDDGRAYQVVRRCGSSAQYYVYDPEIDQKLTTDKSETMDWLCEFLEVEEPGDIPVLFKDAVGVPQGLLTSAFLLAAATRKNTFDPLLRVDEYRAAWGALLDPRRHLEQKIAEEERRIAGFQAEAKALPDLQEKVSGLQAEIEADEKRQAESMVELEGVVLRKETLEEFKIRLARLEQTVTAATGSVNTLEARLTDAESARERSQAAFAVVEEAKDGYRAYQSAQTTLETMDEQRKQRDYLKDTLQRIMTELALQRQELETLETELESIAAAEARKEELCPQVAIQKRLEGGLTEAQRAADRLVHAQQNLDQEQTRLSGLEARLSGVQEGLAELGQVEEQIKSVEAELATLASQRATLTSQAVARETELSQRDEQAEGALKRIAEREQSLEGQQFELKSLEVSLAEVRDGLRELAGAEGKMEALRRDLDRLDEQRSALTSQVATCQAELDQVHAQTSVLEASDAPECPVCNGPLTPQHREELLTSNRAQQADTEAALKEARSQWEETSKALEQKQREIRKLDERVDELPRPRDEEALHADIAAKRSAVAQAQASMDTERADAVANQARREELEAKLSGLRSQQDELEETREQKQRDLTALVDRRNALPRPAEESNLQEQIAAQLESIVETEDLVGELADMPAEVERLTTELQALGDPRRDFQRATDTADQRAAVEQQLVAASKRITELNEQVDVVREDLGAHTDLDERIAAEQAALDTHAADHLRYLGHIREAEALGGRQKQVLALSDELGDAEVKCSQLVEERAQVAAEYDANAYAALVKKYNILNADVAALTERLRLQRNQAAEGQTEIERLTGVQSDLRAARTERAELVEVNSTLGYLRQVLRDAGPMVTKALVEVISIQAARLYADVMGNYTARLRWTKDYEILLTASGRERTFQQLSGGEQMAAALSVRLALLREVSAIDVAFFDEPTANLDDHRRDNLAEQILNVKGFSQLFVISHDDTFERDTDNVIRVVKENGVSRVEV